MWDFILASRKLYDWSSPELEKTISQTKTFLISSGTSEQRLFEIFSGSIGITFDGKYIDVPLSIASRSNAVPGLTSSATSAIATLNVKDDLLNSAVEVSGVRFIAKEVEMEAEDMKNVSFALRKEENLAVVLAAKVDNKALLTVMLTDDLVAKGMDAGAMVREIATEINGGGGGQPFFATAGGANPSGIKNALEKAKDLV